MMIAKQLYQEKYGYEVMETIPEYFLVDELKERCKKEIFPERRRVFLELLREKEMMVALCCEKIQLPFQWVDSNNAVYVEDGYLYVGYLKHNLTWYRRVDKYGDGAGIRYESMYVGELPKHVIDKYKKATKYFSSKELIIVSKDPRLFNIQEIAPGISPLLIGMKKHTNKQFLLTAWGLEHELPKSLGGLLND